MAFKVTYLDAQAKEEGMIIAEKRLYELADGSLVEEVPDGESGSLFCPEGEEMDGERARRYEAAIGKKSVKKAENKAVEKGEDK